MKENNVNFLQDRRMFWYNFRLGDYEHISSDDFTDETVLDYLPQEYAAKGLYRIKRRLGLSMLEAMGEVLKAATGQGEPR